MVKQFRFQPEDHGVRRWMAIADGKIVSRADTLEEAKRLAKEKGITDPRIVEHLSLWEE